MRLTRLPMLINIPSTADLKSEKLQLSDFKLHFHWHDMCGEVMKYFHDKMEILADKCLKKFLLILSKNI
jgi:hypothetical protein